MAASAMAGYQSSDPPPRTDLWWDRIPSLKIVRPPKGIFSQAVDERCFTYCSQSITGRIHGANPSCRSLCLRRVFPHEVSRILAHHRVQTITNTFGKKPVVHVKEHIESAPVIHPLPPEGQRYSGWLAILLGDHDNDRTDTDSNLPRPPAQDKELASWKEGWYIWWSTSPWAAQEKIDVMRRDLDAQTQWQHFKQQKNNEWANGLPFDHNTEDQHHDPHLPDDLGNAPPFPDITSQTVLLPLPTLPTSFAALAPTERMLALVHESVHTGAQRELWGRLWEKARSDEPWRLLAVAWDQVIDNFWPGDNGANGGKG